MNDFKAIPKVIGLKQTLKKVASQEAVQVILAGDSDDNIQNDVKIQCERAGSGCRIAQRRRLKVWDQTGNAV